MNSGLRLVSEDAEAAVWEEGECAERMRGIGIWN